MDMNSSTSSSDVTGHADPALRRAAWGSVATVAGLVVVVLTGAGLLQRSNASLKPWNMGGAEILFVGTSHAGSGVDPNAFKRPVGVMSFRGLDHQLADAVLATNEQRWPRMSIAVIEVDEFTLLTDMTQTGREAPLELLARLDLSIGELPASADRGALWRARMWGSGNGSSALYPRMRWTAKRLFYDPEPAREAHPVTAEAGRLRVEYVHRISEGRVEDNIRALVTSVRRLRSRGVRVVLMSYPEHQYYRAARPRAWDEAVAQAVTAVRTADGPVDYWDFRSDPSFADADFANIDHLSAEGASRLSAILASRLGESR